MSNAISSMASDPIVAKKVIIVSSGLAATGTANVPTIDPYLFGERLASTGMFGFAWIEIIQIISATYIAYLLITGVAKTIRSIYRILSVRWRNRMQYINEKQEID